MKMVGKPRIVVTNDDGIHSPGLKLLYDAVRDLGEIIIIAPETPKSAIGLGITLHKPLRIHEVEVWGVKAYTTNGTPGDAVHLAVNVLSRGKVDLVASGVNAGDNTSIQSILSSGTIGAAIQASLLGIPAVAFSAQTSNPRRFVINEGSRIIIMKRVIREVVSFVLKNGVPEGIDFLSINFPENLTSSTKAKIVPPARRRFRGVIEKRLDPYGKEYYWFYGEPIEPEEGTDVYAIVKEKCIAVTPIALNLAPQSVLENKSVFKLTEAICKAVESLRI